MPGGSGAGGTQDGRSIPQELLGDIQRRQQTDLVLRREAKYAVLHTGPDNFCSGLFCPYAQHQAESGNGKNSGSSFHQAAQQCTFCPDFRKKRILQPVQTGLPPKVEP